MADYSLLGSAFVLASGILGFAAIFFLIAATTASEEQHDKSSA
ncbi:MAG: hypothetical protein ACYCPP_01515 [Nitrososphaerales archaeon]